MTDPDGTVEPTELTGISRAEGVNCESKEGRKLVIPQSLSRGRFIENVEWFAAEINSGLGDKSLRSTCP